MSKFTEIYENATFTTQPHILCNFGTFHKLVTQKVRSKSCITFHRALAVPYSFILRTLLIETWSKDLPINLKRVHLPFTCTETETVLRPALQDNHPTSPEGLWQSTI